MKKLTLYIVLLFSFVSCVKENGESVKCVMRAVGPDFEMAETIVGKTTISLSRNDVPTFAWKGTDVIGVVPDDDISDQMECRIKEIGQNPGTAILDGGDRTLADGNDYIAYYPYSTLKNGGRVDIDVCGQVQTANNSLDHLGGYDYMYAPSVQAGSGNICFGFSHLVSLLRFRIKLSSAATFTGATLSADSECIATGAEIALSEGTPGPVVYTDKFSIGLDNISVAAGETLVLWAFVLPSEAAYGKMLTLTLTDSEGGRTSRAIAGRRYLAGKAYSYDDPLYPEGGYVDLGLSVCWASCNAGAVNPSGTGDFVSWGEVSGKTSYDWTNYRFYEETASNLEDYNWTDVKGPERFGISKYTSKSKAVLEPGDDYATICYGSGWRMPTETEWRELKERCNWIWTEVDGVKGFNVVSTVSGKEGNQIFLPAAGRLDGDAVSGKDAAGAYWTSCLDRESISCASAGLFSAQSGEIADVERYVGLQVRPVISSVVPVSGIEMSRTSASVFAGGTLPLSAEIVPDNASERTLIWQSGEDGVATVDQSGRVSAKGRGKTIISATTSTGFVVGECVVSVADGEPEPVDLGLSVRWADSNLGSVDIEDGGIAFAWGETSGKEACSWDNYRFGSYASLTKYNNARTKNILDIADDAACRNAGGSWRMPTSAEWRELIEFCDWSWTTRNGVSGYTVRSRIGGYEDKSIFIPAAGCIEGDGARCGGSQGYYWSSELDSRDAKFASSLHFSATGVAMLRCKRCFGHSIRPVMDGTTPSDASLASGTTIYGKVSNLGKPVAGVVVSDGVSCTATDANGCYKLPSTKKNGLVFISTPSGYCVNQCYNRPRFWVHTKESADIPERIDFSLLKDPNQTGHTCFLLGDIHIYNDNSVAGFGKFTRHLNALLPSCSGRSIFAQTLGDMTWDWFWYNDGPGYRIPKFHECIGKLASLPTYYTVGNHDHDMKDPSGKWFNSIDEINRTGEDFTVEIPYRELCGPTCHSRNVGKVHYISMDGVFTIDAGDGVKANRGCKLGFNPYDKEWLRQDLSYIKDKNTPIVLTLHIPISSNTPYKWNGSGLAGTSRDELLEAFKGFSNVRIFSAHTHTLINYTDQTLGNGVTYDECVNGAVCGNFWTYSSYGYNLCSDGTPGGFRVMDVDGTSFSSYYQAVDHEGFYPFRSYDRNNIDFSETTVYTYGSYGSDKSNYVLINIWDWKDSWTLSVKEGTKSLSATRLSNVYDPFYLLVKSEKKSGAEPSKTNHIFRVKASSATSTLTIKVTDDSGHSYTETMKRPKAFTVDTYMNEKRFE